MSNRIGGDFNSDAIEAFRAAYAQRLETPEQLDQDELTGLPTNTISNTSPWIEHTGLWKYPSGKGPDEDLKQPFNPSEYLPNEVIDTLEPSDTEEEDEIDSLSDEEIDNMINEILATTSEPDDDQEEYDEE